MLQHAIAANGHIPQSSGKGIPHAGGGQSLKAEVSQQPGGAYVIGIGNDKGVGTRVERLKTLRFLHLRQHRVLMIPVSLRASGQLHFVCNRSVSGWTWLTAWTSWTAWSSWTAWA